MGRDPPRDPRRFGSRPRRDPRRTGPRPRRWALWSRRDQDETLVRLETETTSLGDRRPRLLVTSTSCHIKLNTNHIDVRGGRTSSILLLLRHCDNDGRIVLLLMVVNLW